MEQKLEQALEDAIEKRTFSLEALAAIEALRKDKEEAKERAEQLQSAVDAFEKIISDLREKATKLQEWEARESELSGREKKCMTTEVENGFLLTRGNEFLSLMNNLTRNIAVHHQVYGSRDVTDQYGSAVPRSYTHTEESEAK